MTASLPPTDARARGFSLIEILVVVGIIGLTAAVTLPNITGYVRANRIRAGQDLVAGALQRARNVAIMKNTQMGVTFITQDNNTFWVHAEDTIAGVTAGNVGFTRQGVDFGAPNAVLSTRYDLPDQVEFAASAADCPGVAAYAPNQASLGPGRRQRPCPGGRQRHHAVHSRARGGRPRGLPHRPGYRSQAMAADIRRRPGAS
jgi:prepilin-type N-terminal cleavage/methylation domain-containing protein